MRLYLIRHPRPAVAAGICYGRTDLPLADDPAACAAALRPLLPADIPLFSSPLVRCRRLAELLHPRPRYDARLMELDFGAWEMAAWATLDRALLDAWAADPLGFAPPGGEAVTAMRERLRSLLAELRDDSALVTHAGIMKLAAAELLGVADWFSLPFAFGAISLIEDGKLVWSNKSHDL